MESKQGNLANVVYDQFDNCNREEYYNLVRETVAKQKGSAAKIKELQDKYEDNMRVFFHTSDVLSNQRSNQFFQQVIREFHPTVKLKAPSKNLLKIVTKVYVQELAEACLEVMHATQRQQIDTQVISDAQRILDKRKKSKNNVSALFNHLY